MPWQTTQLISPTSVNILKTHIDGVADSGGGDLSNSNARVNALGAVTWNASAVTANNSLVRFANLKALVQKQLTRIVVTPFDQGIGTGDFNYRYLPAPNAIEHLKSKFLDANDSGKPSGNPEALVLLIVAGNYQQLADNLHSINILFGLPELLAAENRALRLVSLEADKIHQKQPSINPHFIKQQSLQINTVSETWDSAGSGMSLIKAYENQSSNPLTTLSNLITKKQQQLSNAKTAMSDLVNTFNGGNGYVLNLTGDVITGLNQELPVGHEYSLSCAVALVGDASELQFVREVFGL